MGWGFHNKPEQKGGRKDLINLHKRKERENDGGLVSIIKLSKVSHLALQERKRAKKKNDKKTAPLPFLYEREWEIDFNKSSH